MNKRRNESADFVGIDRLKARHAAQVEKFEEWAKERQWNMFHHSRSRTDVTPEPMEQPMQSTSMRRSCSGRTRRSSEGFSAEWSC